MLWCGPQRTIRFEGSLIARSSSDGSKRGPPSFWAQMFVYHYFLLLYLTEKKINYVFSLPAMVDKLTGAVLVAACRWQRMLPAAR